MSLFKHIPNFITCLNLVCGFTGIIHVFNGRVEQSVYLIWLAMLFDFMDGMAARLLRVQSAIGKELDSLADLVTFGVLPGIIVYDLMIDHHSIQYLPFIAAAIAVFSALRLAKFNTDENQTSVFIGVPTPANALFLSSLPFVETQHPELITEYSLLIIVIICSLWLVAPIELFSLKFKSLKWKPNVIRYVFLIIAIVEVLVFRRMALPLIIVTYVCMASIKNASKGSK